MTPQGVAPLLHLVGFLTGATLSLLLLLLVVQITRRHGAPPAVRDRLPLATAVLGLLWNGIGLVALAVQDVLGRGPAPLLVAIAYGALGFLPAVVVHSALRGRGRMAPLPAAVVTCAYGVSAFAQVTLLISGLQGSAPSGTALRVLTWSYGVLILPVLLIAQRQRPGSATWVTVALAVFAVSALHLERHMGGESWPIELFGHHASILLIFAILYQDFRFALADRFLKRALSLFVLLGLASSLYLLVEVPLLSAHPVSGDPVSLGVTVVLWMALALLYPTLRHAADRLVDRLVLHRADPRAVSDRVATRLSLCERTEEVLEATSCELRAALEDLEVGWREEPSSSGQPSAVAVPVPTVEEPRFALVLAALPPGRRLLSGDSELLVDAAVLAGRRIDAMRLSRERFEQRLREREIRQLASEAELRALRAQLRPHFLFNALNTVAFLITTAPDRAYETLLQLTSLLRAVLRPGEATVSVEEELELARSYLEIERARFEERLTVETEIPTELLHLRVPPLLLQPLVENAVKHGIAPSRRGGHIEIDARWDSEGLLFRVRNSGVIADPEAVAAGRRQGVGLNNLEARLDHYYGSKAQLRLRAEGESMVAEVLLPPPEEGAATKSSTLAGTSG